MATGSSKTHWKGKQFPFSQLDDGMELTYAHKRDEASILTIARTTISTLWQPTSDTAINRLYYGDNLPILASLLDEPAIKGKVSLIYIDPPFATNSVFHSRSQSSAYTDVLTGSRYIEFLRERLVFLRELLAPDGSIYLHLDENMAFPMKIIMDELFGKQNFRNWITRKKCNPKNYTRLTYGNVADYILFYSKSDTYIWNRPFEPWSEDTAQKEYQYTEKTTGRRYKKVPLHAPGVRHGETGKPWRGKLPPSGKHWQYPPATLEAMDARDEIYWSPNGNPRRKVYFDESTGIPIQDIWLDCRDAHNQNIPITGYPTEKNPALLERIIAASSNPGDLVLDGFAGSGTTLAVASAAQRRWIGIDNSREAIATILHRFMFGLHAMGDFVTKPTVPEQHALFQKAFDFDGLDGIVRERMNNAESHHPITDFALLAAEATCDELADMTQLWLRWLQEISPT